MQRRFLSIPDILRPRWIGSSLSKGSLRTHTAPYEPYILWERGTRRPRERYA